MTNLQIAMNISVLISVVKHNIKNGDSENLVYDENIINQKNT